MSKTQKGGVTTEKTENETNVTTGQQPVPDVPTSETLEKLLKEKVEIAARLRSENLDEQLKAVDEITVINAKIKSEEAAIRKAAIDAKIAEEKNARVALADDLINAVLKAYGVGKKDRTPESDAKFAEQRDVVVTELLARYTSSKPAKRSSSSQSGGTRGATTQAIRELIVPMYTNGVDGSEVRRSIIKDHGFNDGTANAVILAYEKEIGLK